MSKNCKSNIDFKEDTNYDNNENDNIDEDNEINALIRKMITNMIKIKSK